MRTKTVYVAEDGKEFDREEECVVYENNELTRKNIIQFFKKHYFTTVTEDILNVIHFIITERAFFIKELSHKY